VSSAKSFDKSPLLGKEKNQRLWKKTGQLTSKQCEFMKKPFFWIALLLVLVVILLCPASALAAPGGKIVTGLFKTPLGKVLLAILAVVLSPLIAYVMIKEHIAQKRTLKLLRQIAPTNPVFDWMTLRDRITDCYHRVHAAWRAEDMSEASEWMTSWYWQNQQLAYLNQWERDGLVNHCRVKGISKIRPLFLSYRSAEDGAADGSRLVVSISAKMEDYLAQRATGKIVEGKKGYADTEHVWTFVLQKGKWLVANIEEGSMSLSYARLPVEVPQGLPVKAATGAGN
jgi:hypothetical protein